MTTWLDIALYIFRHRLPLTLVAFGRERRLMDTASGEWVAGTVEGAEKYLTGSGGGDETC
jgi:hypothetical protein